MHRSSPAAGPAPAAARPHAPGSTPTAPTPPFTGTCGQGNTRQTRPTAAASAERVIANATGPNNRRRSASVTDNATDVLPTSTATTTVDDVTGAACTDTTHLR